MKKIEPKNIDLGNLTKTTAVCKQHGKYTTYSGEMGIGACPACIEEESRREAQELSMRIQTDMAKARIRKIFEDSAVPKIFQHLTLDDYKPACEGAELAKNAAENYIRKFATVRKIGSCALFIGSTGTGKTMLAAIIANHILKQGYTAHYIECVKAMRFIKASWNPKAGTSEYEQIAKFGKADFAIIDDIPKGIESQREIDYLHGIINERTNNLLPTICITTLKNKEQLISRLGGEDGGGAELVRRMMHQGREVDFHFEKFKTEKNFW